MAGNLGTLPPEIIGEILDYLPPKKIHRLASISRKFNACCSRIVHRDIELHDFERVKRCCETLAFNHTAAGYVKRLSLSFSDRSVHLLFNSTRLTLFAPGVRSLPNLPVSSAPLFKIRVTCSYLSSFMEQ